MPPYDVDQLRYLLKVWPMPTNDQWEVVQKAVPAMLEHIQQLDALCTASAQTVNEIEDWWGHASTGQAARDSLWRLGRMLEKAGYRTMGRRDTLDWRGSLLDELWKAGFHKGEDDLMHLDLNPAHCHGEATGPTLEDVVEFYRLAHATPKETSNE